MPARRRRRAKKEPESGVQHTTRRVEPEEGSQAVHSVAVGRLRDGWQKYQIGEVIAEGGMGVVRLAEDRNSRRVVAMKILPKYQEVDEQDFLRFIEEAQITAQLEHPNIIPFYELGSDPEGNAYYTMKYMRGLTLADILEGIRSPDEQGRRLLRRFPLRRLLEIFCHVCDAISFAHSRRVVHRDLKPENIIVGNGSLNLIQLIYSVFVDSDDEVILPIPSFEQFEYLLSLVGGKPVYIPL